MAEVGAAPLTRPSSKTLSSTLVVSTLNVTAVPTTLRLPLTVRSLVTVRSFPIVTSSGRPTVIVPLDSATVTSFVVPLNVIVPPREVAVLLVPSETLILLFARSVLARVPVIEEAPRSIANLEPSKTIPPFSFNSAEAVTVSVALTVIPIPAPPVNVTVFPLAIV